MSSAIPTGALRVSEVVTAAAGVVARGFPRVRVVGELASVSLSSRGHLWFELKDNRSSVSCVLWASDVARLKSPLEVGQEVLVAGALKIWTQQGQFRLEARSVRPIGEGAKALVRRQLLQRLKAEGLFDESQKRALPLLPTTIGIVTSRHSAALQDVLQVLGRRQVGARVVVAHASVQGRSAEVEIERGIRLLAGLPGLDVMIVTRGGGSSEDLIAFDSERVVRAIAESPVPVISAVGHETDLLLTDLVADHRAPTPSAAAERVAAARVELLRRVDSARNRLQLSMSGQCVVARSRWQSAARSPAIAAFQTRLVELSRRRLALEARLQQAPHGLREKLHSRYAAAARFLHSWPASLALDDLHRRVAVDSRRLRVVFTASRRGAGGRLSAGAARLDALSPLAVLGRGYSIAFDSEDRVIRAESDVMPGSSIRIRLGQGGVRAMVTGRDGDQPPRNELLFPEDS